MPDPHDRTVRAAGGVVWRRVDGEVQVVLVHRPKYDDWSLPKGKLDPGEPAVVGAVREVAEETGFVAVPGRTLGESRYRVLDGGRDVAKTVRWWAMRCHAGSFVPGPEVDVLRWLPVRAALSAAGSTFDTAPLQAFADGPPDTTTVLVTEAVAPDERVVRAYRPTRVVAADASVEGRTAPLAQRLGLPHERDAAVDVTRLSAGPSALVCLPQGAATGVLAGLGLAASSAEPLWALTFCEGRLVDAVDVGRQEG